MSLVVKSYTLITAADGTLATINGAVTTKIAARGRVAMIAVAIGTLTGAGTLLLTDTATGLVICNNESFTDFGTGKQKAFMPVAQTDATGTAIASAVAPAFATGQITVAVTGGGASTTGTLWLAWEV